VENINSPTYFLHQLPARTQDILNSQGLLPVHVHRNGPRFVAATVKDAEGQKFFFKQALPGVPADPMMHDKVGDRIIYEAEFLKFLDESGFPHLYTKIVKLSPSEPVWMLRQHLPGFTMTDGDSLYRFKPEFYGLAKPELVVTYFRGLQDLTRALPARLKSWCARHELSLQYYEDATNWTGTIEPRPELARYTEAIGRFFNAHRNDFDGAERFLAHCEPYPPHMFVLDEQIGLIDWENLAFRHRLHDLSKVWIRALENPAWQKQLECAIEEAGWFEGQGRVLWKIEILMQSIANFVYFKYHSEDEPAYRQLAMDHFLGNIESTLS
jgi:hypothetical protein